jgi:PAS domain S-box-containing protein
MLIDEADEVRPVPTAPPPAATDTPARPPARSERVPDAITLAGGALCVAVGLAVIVAWFVRATAFLQFGSLNPMSFNTALAFVVTGAALVALARGHPQATLAAGLFDAALGTLILTEYASGHGLGIDQLFVEAYITGPHDVPGRMAVNTAVCLTLLGAGLLVWGPWRSRPRPAVIAAAASAIGAIAAEASFGYATGNPAAYGWTHVTAMAFLTAVTFLILVLSLLSAAWRDSRTRLEGPPRWLPMPAGALALGLGVWLVIDGRAVAAGRISSVTFTAAVSVLGLVVAGLVMLVVWLAQQADRGRRVAVTAAAELSEAEREAREGEHRLFQFLGALPVAVFIASPGGRPYYANDEATRLLGRGVAPGIGAGELAETYSVFLTGTDRHYPTERLPVVRALRGQPTHDDDLEIRKPDGAVIPLEIWGCPVYGAGGQVDYGMSAFADMSVRNAREKLIAGQAALLDLAHDAIFVRDLDGQITYWNAGAEQTYGFTRAEAVGQISHDLLRTQFPEPVASIETAADRRGVWEGELTHRCADGRAIIVESRWAAQRGPGGSLLGFLEVNRDITSRKDAERESLRQAHEVRALNATLEQRVRQRTVRLERANKNLAAFTYSAAHDLRTPLRALSGFAEVLVEEYGDRLDEKGRGYAELIQQATEHTAALLDDLLHLSQVSRTQMNLQDVDLSAEVTAACGQLRTRDPGRQVRVTVEDGVRAIADPPLIRTVLVNLLENAWKFSAGREDASIEFATTPADDAPLCCYVRDNGAGFDPAYVGKLFQPFQRLHGAGEFSGTGIGLAIVQRIIDRHGGRTWAEGAVGHGATIYFTLDVKNTSLRTSRQHVAIGKARPDQLMVKAQLLPGGYPVPGSAPG